VSDVAVRLAQLHNLVAGSPDRTLYSRLEAVGGVVSMVVGLEARDTIVNVRAIVAVHKVIFGKY